MSYAALKVPDETKEKFRKAGEPYPRVPLSQVADAVIDGWHAYLTPEQRNACIARNAGKRPRRRDRQTA